MSPAETSAQVRTLVFYDDAKARTFEPFALSRPLSEMRVGALLMRERWEHALRAKAVSFVGAPQLAHFTEENAPVFESGLIPAGTVLVNSRAAIALADAALSYMRKEDRQSPPNGRTWYVNGVLAAVQLRGSLNSALLANGTLGLEEIAALDLAADATAPGGRQTDVSEQAVTNARVDVNGIWLEEVWDIVRHLTALLNSDIPALAAVLKVHVRAGNAHDADVLGEHSVYQEEGATIERYTVFDTTLGPILLRKGASVQAFTRVVGPCYIGMNSTVTGDRISGSAIGDMCRVHGELSATVFVGHSNKGHDGFVGHSIVGRWVNMGAGTITSNLKNTYGTVALWTPAGIRDTGLQFLGTLFGDHTKTGIGLKLTTGCVLGTAANVFDRMQPKAVEPFAWGNGTPYDSYSIDKFVETAERMMSRRHVALSDEGRTFLRDVHAARWKTP
ncbi:MAG: putative sugar nucleotidyl transferase [Gemmatimonadaceae bacterium]